MKQLSFLNFFVFALLLVASLHGQAQNPVNWTAEQLIEPSALVKELNAQKDSLLVLSVGPGALIPNSKDMGMASKPEGLTKLTELLKTVPKGKRIIIYCGCCPFEHCPNVRPAMALLKDMHFTNYYLLDLPHNLKQDWIDQGYPTTKM